MARGTVRLASSTSSEMWHAESLPVGEGAQDGLVDVMGSFLLMESRVCLMELGKEGRKEHYQGCSIGPRPA